MGSRGPVSATNAALKKAANHINTVQFTLFFLFFGGEGGLP